MVLDRSAGHCCDSAIFVCRRRGGDALVELAAASAVWLANAYLLASPGIAGAMPDSVWRARTWRAGASRRARVSRAGAGHGARGGGRSFAKRWRRDMGSEASVERRLRCNLGLRGHAN